MANPSALFESHNLIVIVVKLEELDDDALDGRLVFVRPTERDTPVTLVDSRVVTVWGITNQATGHWRKSWRAPQVGGGGNTYPFLFLYSIISFGYYSAPRR